MTTPTTPSQPRVPHRRARAPGTPEQVWDAIATADGLSSWFPPTEVDERRGRRHRHPHGRGRLVAGEITGWDPPRRLAYEEPDWAVLPGHEGAAVTPWPPSSWSRPGRAAPCVVRVVTSAFGTGADWEQEFFDA